MQIRESIVASELVTYFLYPFIDSSRPKLDALERVHLLFLVISVRWVDSKIHSGWGGRKTGIRFAPS